MTRLKNGNFVDDAGYFVDYAISFNQKGQFCIHMLFPENMENFAKETQLAAYNIKNQDLDKSLKKESYRFEKLY